MAPHLRALPLLLAFAACATLHPPALAPAAPADATALDRAVEQFYLGTTPKDLTQAVEAARLAGPDTARFHEISARLAQLEGREADVAEHLMAALTDTADPAALLHFHALSAQELTFERREAFVRLCQALAKHHPSAELRAAAAWTLAAHKHLEGDVDGRDRALALVPGRVTFDVAGPWDNDEGKGFDLELDAERRPQLDQTYEGRLGPVTWRLAAPVDPLGRLDLADLMFPQRFVAAMAHASLDAPKDGAYLLSLTTTDPLKVWVDGKLVFAAAELRRSVTDGLTVPLTLSAGKHTLLIKSAHREGTWKLAARFVPAPAPSPAVHDVKEAVQHHLTGFEKASARAAQAAVAWTHALAGGTATVSEADRWLVEAPRSIVARVWLADALWYNQERGRTADLLGVLDAELGDALPFIALRQTRFHLQQGLKQKTRDRLLELVATKPHLKEAFGQLVDVYRAEGWTEDEKRQQRQQLERFGETPGDLQELASIEQRHGHRGEAQALLERIVARLPFHGGANERLVAMHLEAGELGFAAYRLERVLALASNETSLWVKLAEVRRRQDDAARAQVALSKAQALNPSSPSTWQRQGDLAYEAGDTAAALTAWRQSLDRNPENESLANRVEFLAPEARGPWMADMPSEADIEKAVHRREGLKQVPGADSAWLLDHEVTLLNADGSTSNVVTVVLHAFNEQGRDRVIRQRLPSGRVRVLQAYSVDARGVRAEAGGERNRQIFFRGMQAKSTLVLQYRADQAPEGFLKHYLTKSWSFQSVAEQRLASAFILWMPLGTKLHELKVGDVRRSEEKRGQQLRIVWRADDVPPLLAEPAMPTASELAANIRLSTVPDWEAWLSWERALLEGAFRSGPDVEALAKTMGEGAPDANEKLRRVHRYVMEEIRYQQDYESFIAGVKPHPAPMVLERRYGDCKDKAVLFISLAKQLGLDAHFALVRTRDSGPVAPDVPMQQFNHAIVYVPAQKGVAEGRFFDPTANKLDLDVVRHDDVGTQSLVFDPFNRTHTWRGIPYQAPQLNRERSTLTLALGPDGSAKGTVRIEGAGRQGSSLRRTAANDEVFSQVSQRVAAHLVPTAIAGTPKAVSVESLETPAIIEVDVDAKAFARVEDDTLRVKMPLSWRPRDSFALATRRYPLVLGTPAQYETATTLSAPEGFVFSRVPQSASVTLPCLSFEREVVGTAASVTTTLRFRITCERITAQEYGTYREKAEEMTRLAEEEVVLGRKGGAGKAKKAPGPAGR